MKLLVLLSFSQLFKFSSAQLNRNVCGQKKGCILHPPNCNPDKNCAHAFSWRVSSEGDYIIMELSAKQADPSAQFNFVAVGYSDDPQMGGESVTECVVDRNGNGRAHLSYNIGKHNVRITDLSENDISNVVQVLSSNNNNGRIYCLLRQKIQSGIQHESLKDLNGDYRILLASGISGDRGIRAHSMERNTPAFPLISPNRWRISNPGAYKLALDDPFAISEDTKLKLLKSHAILMLIAWFVFVAIAVLFARYYRNDWPDREPKGLKIWFHMHQTLNTIAVLVTIAAFVCILAAVDWRWKGPEIGGGEQNAYPSVVHAITGLLACLLVWIQPIIAYFRCSPQHSKRPVFNWTHRLIGIVAFLLAVTTVLLAAVAFVRNKWPLWDGSWSLILVIVYLVGVALIFVGHEIVSLLERKRTRQYKVQSVEMKERRTTERKRIENGHNADVITVTDQGNKYPKVRSLLLIAFVFFSIAMVVLMALFITNIL